MTIWEILNANFVVGLLEALAFAAITFVWIGLPIMQRLRMIERQVGELHDAAHVMADAALARAGRTPEDRS